MLVEPLEGLIVGTRARVVGGLANEGSSVARLESRSAHVTAEVAPPDPTPFLELHRLVIRYGTPMRIDMPRLAPSDSRPGPLSVPFTRPEPSMAAC